MEREHLLPKILPLFPQTYNRYYEPFLGGGAVFFAFRPRIATLSDHNRELIECYREVRDHPLDVIDHLARMENSESSYYKIREEEPCSSVERAARLIYLVTLSFNGIYRVNFNGEFNVPYDYKSHLIICNRERILNTSEALQNATLLDGDFEYVLGDAEEGDIIYIDPPYTVAHSKNGFLKYNSRIFSWDDQVRLSVTAKELSTRGCHVFVSNAYHDAILELYSDFSLIVVERSSRIAASSNFRGQVNECIFYREP